jgi:tRNA dimethylallyltransferase
LVSIPNIPIRFRNKIRNLHKNLGQKKFYQKLIKLDPYSKEKINPTDTQRSIRAYEVKQFTKKSLHDWFKNTKSYFEKEDFFKIYIDYPREELIQRIGKRTEQMIKIGAINEVKRFIKLKVRKDKSVNKAIGIYEIKEYLEKRNDMSEVIEKISIKTRQYAKRQSTWARGNMMSWLKLPPQDLNKFLKKIK